MAAKNKILDSLHHLLIGFALTLKGINKISHHPVIGSIILLFGIIILGYFLYIVIKKHTDKTLVYIIHWFEAIASLFTAYVFFEEGATYLPYAFLLAAIGFFIAIIVHHTKKHPAH